MDRNTKMIRSSLSQFQTREDGGELRIEGYFAVFNSIYEMGMGMSESIAPGAFSNRYVNSAFKMPSGGSVRNVFMGTR